MAAGTCDAGSGPDAARLCPLQVTGAVMGWGGCLSGKT